MSANEVAPGPPDLDPGSPNTLNVGQQPGPPTDPAGSPETLQVNPGPPNNPGGSHVPAVQVGVQPGPPNSDSQPGPPNIESQPGPPTIGREKPKWKQYDMEDPVGTPHDGGQFHSASGLKSETEVLEGDDQPPDPTRIKSQREPGNRKVFLLGIFLLLMCLLLGMAAILSGAFNPGGGSADQPTHDVTEPVSTEDTTTPTVPPDETEVLITGFCGSACGPDGACSAGLVCSPNTDPNIQGSNACLRNGHCGCGVPCDPSGASGASACDPGLSCVTTNGVSTCWAGGCEVTQPPTCVVTPGDGVCSECETVDTDPASCAPPDDGGGSNGGGGAKPCRCKTVCAGIACTRVCTYPNGQTCRP